MLWLLVCYWLSPLQSQTTQATLSGRISDRETGTPAAGVTVRLTQVSTSTEMRSETRDDGRYSFPGLTPGAYVLVAEAPGYQVQQLSDLLLPVASNTLFDVELRRLEDVWEQRLYRGLTTEPSRAVLRFYGPDLDSTRTVSRPAPDLSRTSREAVLSDVITTEELRGLPLAGRDAYTLLFRQPGVTSDAGSARGLGLSVSGQRPSASNFLLDGLENNNYLTSGPLHGVPPEAIQEYRISTGNYSAEYGRASGFVANAVTAQAGVTPHLIAYVYAKHDALAANTFQRNLSGIGRAPLNELQPGVTLTSPLVRARLFATASYEHFATHTTGQPVKLQLPSANYLQYTSAGSRARMLLDPIAAQLPRSTTFVASGTFEPPLDLRRGVALGRLDHGRGAQRFFLRFLDNRMRRPDFVWTPYKEFSSTLNQETTGLMASWSTPVGSLWNELRTGWQTDTLGWDRPHPEIPTLTAVLELQTPGVENAPAALPGSPAFYAYRNRPRNMELVENLSGWRGAHSWKVGGALLLRGIDGYLTAGRDGNILFDDLNSFLTDDAYGFLAPVSRTAITQMPEYGARYHNRQASLFVQDNWRIQRRLQLSFGLRYETFGVPVSRGIGLYDRDLNNVAPRAGLSWQPAGDFGPVVRVSFGIFYDRPFDNLWQNLRTNSFSLAAGGLPFRADYLAGVSALIQRYPPVPLSFPEPLRYQAKIRDAYSQNFFAGVQQGLSDHLSVEWNAMGTLGRKLITTDRIERPNVVVYRANQGLSNYYGASIGARYRSGSLQLRAAYTWSHWIDTQSEPLAGDFFNLDFTRTNYSVDRPAAAFSRERDSQGDRGNSDFDQRHNFGVSGIWDVPKLKGWRVAALAAARSGFPYTVYSPQLGLDENYVFNRRANIQGPTGFNDTVPGGRRILNPNAFVAPTEGTQGNLGRNALHGPGLYNFDASVAKTVVLREGIRMTFRADVFNVLNHVNLNHPESVLGSPDFGIARYGRTGRDTGFPALFPLNESPRQVQLLIRFEF